jgi:hypothetical protein
MDRLDREVKVMMTSTSDADIEMWREKRWDKMTSHSLG